MYYDQWQEKQIQHINILYQFILNCDKNNYDLFSTGWREKQKQKTIYFDWNDNTIKERKNNYCYDLVLTKQKKSFSLTMKFNGYDYINLYLNTNSNNDDVKHELFWLEQYYLND